MRPNQNKRMRGRNTGNRKGPNPLSRTYESNGPDVKIRGTAHHIGEKYLQLARDAQSSGDPVMAESLLQHAEHYFRLIAAAQVAQQASSSYQRQPGEPEAEEYDEDEDFVGGMDRFASPIERVSTAQPAYAPPANGQPAYPERERANGNGERPLMSGRQSAAPGKSAKNAKSVRSETFRKEATRIGTTRTAASRIATIRNGPVPSGKAATASRAATAAAGRGAITAARMPGAMSAASRAWWPRKSMATKACRPSSHRPSASSRKRIFPTISRP